MLKNILIINIILNMTYNLFNINIYFKYFRSLSIPSSVTDINLSIKNTDNMTINFVKNSYYNISNLLNSKYIANNINNNLSKRESLHKKKISYYIIDKMPSFYTNPQYKLLKKILKRKYILEITSDNPDYIIFDVFGCSHLDEIYQNSIKIAFFTENQIPDFNIADYAIGQSHIIYLDRYFKRSYFLGLLFTFNNRYLQIIRKKVLNSHKRKKFCAAVISNNITTDYFRLEFIEELNKYKNIDMGGSYKNNVGYIKNKIKFLSSYKFSIAMENTEGNGYLSEKIIESFMSGTIPIYYGDYMVDEYINTKSFILIRDKNDMFKKIDYIKKIDNNDELYEKILKENIFIDNYFKEKIENERIEFLYHIFDQDKKKAKRIDNYHWS
jgi:hypothetical protein